jgi:hypothetical protein
MVRLCVILSVFISSAIEAKAIERLSATVATCEAVVGIVQRDGDVILRFPSKRVVGMTLYTRYVRNDRHCESNDRAVTKSVQTADQPQCELLVCSPRSRSQRR